jgi:hypothetical protein
MYMHMYMHMHMYMLYVLYVMYATCAPHSAAPPSRWRPRRIDDAPPARLVAQASYIERPHMQHRRPT